MSDTGWTDGKFVVKHYRRGSLLDGEAFVLVPERDPAAVEALRAYAQSTTDPELAYRLAEWANRITGACDHSPPEVIDLVPSWVATLAEEVTHGALDIQAALFKMARLILTTTTTTKESK